MYKHIRHDAEMARLEGIIESGHVNKRNALSELIEPTLKISEKKAKRRA